MASEAEPSARHCGAARARGKRIAIVDACSTGRHLAAALREHEISAALGTPGNGMSRLYACRNEYQMVTALPDADVAEEDEALPSSARAVMAHPAGHQIPRTLDVLTSPGAIYLISDDPGQIRADYRKLRQIKEDYLYDPARVSAA